MPENGDISYKINTLKVLWGLKRRRKDAKQSARGCRACFQLIEAFTRRFLPV
jgi:hypothetical protein